MPEQGRCAPDEWRRGEHVAKVQFALFALDSSAIDRNEVRSQTYGPSTAKAVLAYKTKRKIINTAYQSTPDNIVGKMTITGSIRTCDSSN